MEKKNKNIRHWEDPCLLLVVSLVFFIAILFLENSFVGLFYEFINSGLDAIIPLIFVGFFLIFFCALCFVFKPFKKIKRQKLYEQKSWVYYFYYGFIVAFCYLTLYSLTIYLSLSPFFESSVSKFFNLFSINKSLREAGFFLFFNPGMFFILALIYKYIEPIQLSNEKRKMRFADGAVDKTVDQSDHGLNFYPSAKNVAIGLSSFIKESKDNVSVIALYGDQGFGKSSYARMIIEDLDYSKILYSYISLTETNEAKDFSRLFSERWFQTINSRYPKLSPKNSICLMQSILRESGNGFIAGLIGFCSNFNKGLRKTRAKYWDKYFNNKDSKFVSSEIAEVFGNVPRFNEYAWIILVDEIERAPFSEVYRLIEIIERFKIEGRSGLPIKLIFLLCVSGKELELLIERFINKQQKASLINNFFFYGGKSIERRLFLPIVSRNIKTRFICNLLGGLRREEAIEDDLSDLSQYSAGSFIEPYKDFPEKHNEAIEFVLKLIRNESPRIIHRCIQEMEFFYRSFLDKAGNFQKEYIRFSDILILSYIKIKYPFLIDFFIKTIDLILIREAHEDDFLRHTERWSKHDEFKEGKLQLSDWIEGEIGHVILKSEKDKVNNLVGVVAHKLIDLIEEKHEKDIENLVYAESKSLSDPIRMLSYLQLAPLREESDFDTFFDIYSRHQQESTYLEKVNNNDFLTYIRLSRDYPQFPINMHLDIIKEILSRIESNRITIQLKHVRDSIYQSYIYEFVFQLLRIIESEADKSKKDASMIEAIEVFGRILLSRKVNIMAKYIILNSFINESRKGGVGGRFIRAFNEIKELKGENWVRLIIKKVFQDVEKRYFKGDKIVYKKEENFFYVLYQSWSGDPSKKSELESIKRVAKRGLVDNHDAIALYWSKVPSIEELEDKDHFVHDIDKEEFATGKIYMSIKDLVDISKKAGVKEDSLKKKINGWDKEMKQKKEAFRRYKYEFAVKEDKTTLKAVLLEKGWLNSN